jgi:capsular polysaccharide biosynthesis protein
MSFPAWEVNELDAGDPSIPGRPLPALVSLHFLRAAVRRRRVACLLFGLLGLFGGFGYLIVAPPGYQASAALLLAHDATADPTLAMATDITLLNTRSVANQAVSQLGLSMSADDFLSTMSATSTGSQVMTVTLEAPNQKEAVRRLSTLTDVYLTYRASQVTAQANYLVDGLNKRIATLQAQVADLTTRLSQLQSMGAAGANAVNDAISQRSQLTSQVISLQQSAQDQLAQANSIVAASRVIDPAAVKSGGRVKHIALALGTGLLAGLVIGVGGVLFLAITSDKLRRRFEVAAALEVPVSVSAGILRPLPRWTRRLPRALAVNARRMADRQRVAHALTKALPVSGRRGWLMVACLDNSDEMRFAALEAALSLQRSGDPAFLVDLTGRRVLDEAMWELSKPEDVDGPIIMRPRTLPTLSQGPEDLYTANPWRPRHNRRPGSSSPVDTTPLPKLPDGKDLERRDSDSPQVNKNAAFLVLADVDPVAGVDHLPAWGDKVVLAVSSGQSSAERVRTAGDLIRGLGLNLSFAIMLHTDPTDDSSGNLPTAGRRDRESTP